ncbi:hypothetical protein M422DRAFT_253530 [Sphaerobolus stellatus SS14]|uniref:Uncharacterized protein n=1 Tax=Sphaerobolus stellatus (strain SS14) TaxID=990650 RepID=A0A0C9VN23_SPHS4|nr:hypothetical protein M422DRAFT_253530 [Sphaerobolus stellatus SS14]
MSPVSTAALDLELPQLCKVEFNVIGEETVGIVLSTGNVRLLPLRMAPNHSARSTSAEPQSDTGSPLKVSSRAAEKSRAIENSLPGNMNNSAWSSAISGEQSTDTPNPSGSSRGKRQASDEDALTAEREMITKRSKSNSGSTVAKSPLPDPGTSTSLAETAENVPIMKAMSKALLISEKLPTVVFIDLAEGNADMEPLQSGQKFTIKFYGTLQDGVMFSTVSKTQLMVDPKATTIPIANTHKDLPSKYVRIFPNKYYRVLQIDSSTPDIQGPQADYNLHNDEQNNVPDATTAIVLCKVIDDIPHIMDNMDKSNQTQQQALQHLKREIDTEHVTGIAGVIKKRPVIWVIARVYSMHQSKAAKAALEAAQQAAQLADASVPSKGGMTVTWKGFENPFKVILNALNPFRV